MSVDDPYFRLRLTQELRDLLAPTAGANNRSIDAEIVFRLQQSTVDMSEGSSGDLPSRDEFVLRMPDGIRDRFDALAKRHGRSTNFELVVALTDWLQRHEAEGDAAAAAPEQT